MRAIILVSILSVFSFATTIKIASYNVNNLFDALDNGNEYRDFKLKSGNWNEKKYTQKIKNIKKVIIAINADIIALQEIENEEVLKELAKNTAYKYATFKTTKNAPVGLGVLSKIKPIKTEYFAVPNVKTRDILKLNFSVDGKSFSLFNVHFPAYKNGFDKQQKAERTLRRALENVKNGVIVGDFNTPYFKNSGKNLLYHIQHAKQYQNLWEFLKPKERFSQNAYGKKRAIDHALLSPDIINSVEISYVCGSYKVYKRGLVDANDYALKINKKPIFSDHLPIVFDLSTDKKGKCKK
ncbi:endonuclease/exonuclease/phosphatase family protein [Campylobacter majalis]|uniref:endonuclease/exonuclease/phosphatase family protein n=1 Tax=Campylobacter majalis TaxID=2790656 RepID=UPI003D69B55D